MDPSFNLENKKQKLDTSSKTQGKINIDVKFTTIDSTITAIDSIAKLPSLGNLIIDTSQANLDSNLRVLKLDSSSIVKDSMQIEIMDSTIIKDSLNNSNKFSLSIGLGPSISRIKTSIWDNSNFNVPEYEYTINTPSIGLKLNYQLTKSLNISSGFDLFSNGEKIESYGNYSMNYDSTFVDTVNNLGEFTIISVNGGSYFSGNSPNPTSINPDTSTYSITYDTSYWLISQQEDTLAANYNIVNRYYYLQIPLSIGYQFNYKKIKFGINLGGSYNIRLNNSSGMYFNNTYSSLELVPVKKHTINFVTSIHIGYQFKIIEVFIEPRYWLNITNSIDFNNSNHRYETIGGYIGLKFDL